jgi:hypothetical protein
MERELAGERIRDKFAASRAKGMWMGGSPPLGYDVKDRKLVVNAAEAELVRLIFRRFVDLGSTLLLIRELNAQARATGPSRGGPRPAPSERVDRSTRARSIRSCAIGRTSARPSTRARATRASTSRSSTGRPGIVSMRS